MLQTFGKDNFPLEKYIVDVNKDISPPSYLTNGSAYIISNGLPDTDPETKTSLVEIMSNQPWPPREDFNLDESQYEAFRAALTKQMVVIQGPPGKLIQTIFIFLLFMLYIIQLIQERVKRTSAYALLKFYSQTRRNGLY